MTHTYTNKNKQTSPSEESIISYLCENTNFLIENRSLLKEIMIPHLLESNMSSLIERQVEILREENSELENNFENTLSGSDRNAKYLGKNSIISRTSIGCEWPIGEPNEPSFHYCGSKKLEGKSYCLEHCSKAYILPEKIKSEEVAA